MNKSFKRIVTWGLSLSLLIACWCVPNNIKATSSNIALGKSVVTSSIESGLNAQYAIDGDIQTRWGSDWSDPQWIYVDLGESMTVNEVLLRWETAYGKSYSIQVSNDATNWSDVFTTTSGDGGTDDITFEATSARYVRMLGAERGTGWGYSLFEFEVFGDGNEGGNDEWTLYWSDEFDSDTLDLTKWKYETGNWIVDDDGNAICAGWGNNEKQYYTNSTNNIFISDGNLILRALEEEVSDEFGTYQFTSGKLVTNGLFSKKYGKFEARMKLPSGQGLWPAFWMMPQDEVYGGWAASGEIDIMEAAGSNTSKVGGTIHYGDAWPNNAYSGADYQFPQGESTTDFHVYSVEWEPGEIRWYVDDNLYQTQNNWYSTNYEYPAPFDQEFYIILNLAVGGWYDGDPGDLSIFPAQVVVDYVRVYE